MNVPISAVTLGLLLCAGGCAATEQVEAPPAAPFATTQQGQAAPSAPAEASRALTLDDVVALAFERNPDIRAAAERIAEAEARVGEATAGFFPQISTRLSYTRTDNPSQAFGMILAQRRFSLSANFNNPGPTQDVRPEIIGTMPLFRGGQDYQRRAAAMLGVEAARLERAALRNALADAAIAAYYALLAGPEHVEVTRLSIGAVESALNQARARFETGAALKSDVLSLEVRLAAAREAHARAKNAVELVRAGLRLLLGCDADTPIEVVAAAAQTESSLADSFPAALLQARTARPELQAAERVVAMRQREVNVERAAYFPRVDAVASYGQDAADLKLSRTRDNWAVGAAAELDLFSGFRTGERVRAAERRLAEAREAARKVRLDVERDVRTAFLALEEARERAQVDEAAVGAADEALRLVEAQYHAGAVTITRYLEAEVARTDARSRAIAARYDTRRAAAGLRKAMGLWAGEDSR